VPNRARGQSHVSNCEKQENKEKCVSKDLRNFSCPEVRVSGRKFQVPKATCRVGTMLEKCDQHLTTMHERIGRLS